MKFVVFLLFSIPKSLSGFSIENRRYKTSKLPQTDLKVINAEQTNIVSRQWFNKIMEDFFEKQQLENDKISELERARRQRNALEDFSQNYILKNINKLESYFQSSMKERFLYLAWMPEEITTKSQKDVLALIVCDEKEESIILKCIITNPSWTCDNIESKELKNCLEALETKEHMLNITEFYSDPNNVRFKLDWSF